MAGVIFSILAGLLISLQGVFNTRLGDKIGLWETSALVHAIGFVVAFIFMMLFGTGNLRKIGEVNKLYIIGGAFGVIVIYSIIKSISLLGAAYSVAILLVTQLIISTLIDSFGLFGVPQIKFHFTKALGLFVMIIGIVIFKFKG